jgi:hypothetical protein
MSCYRCCKCRAVIAHRQPSARKRSISAPPSSHAVVATDDDAGYSSNEGLSEDSSDNDPDDLAATDIQDLLDLAAFAGLSDDDKVMFACKRGKHIRYNPGIQSLAAHSRQYLARAVGSSILAIIRRISPLDANGLWFIASSFICRQLQVFHDQAAVTASTDGNKLLQSVSRSLCTTLPKSPEHRALLAVAARCGRSVLARVWPTQTDVVSCENVSAAAALLPERELTDRRYHKARYDGNRMLAGVPLLPVVISRQRFSASRVSDLVDFLQRPENTVGLGYGWKKVQLGDKSELIAARYRVEVIQRLYVRYRLEYPDDDAAHRTVFYSVANAITAKDLKVLHCLFF